MRRPGAALCMYVCISCVCSFFPNERDTCGRVKTGDFLEWHRGCCYLPGFSVAKSCMLIFFRRLSVVFLIACSL